VLFAEVAALLWVFYQIGAYTLESWRRRKARKDLDLEALCTELSCAPDAVAAAGLLSKLGYSVVTGPAVTELATQGLTRLRAVKVLTDAEQYAARRLDKTRVFIRLGPILGLMGTLIPISPALVAMAKGDIDTLSANLIVAFSTTVVGLLIGSIAYLISLGRERNYTQDLTDLEYVLERAGV
jgi:biopolymer transport protein ExbB/TolQ